MKIINKILVFLVIMMMIFAMTPTFAAGSFEISVSKATIDKGESVTLTIVGKNAYGKVNITATNATISSSSVFLQNDTKTVTITSNSTEDIKVTVAPSSEGLGDAEENPITESKSLTITVNKPVNDTPNQSDTPTTPTEPEKPDTPTVVEKSSNANATNIETSPVDFSGFRKNTTSGYAVNVKNDVDKIYVKVTKEDSKASVSLLNKTNSDTGKSWVYIKEGSNEINVTLTAEDGKTTKTYTINVTREEKADEEEKEEKPEEDPMEEVFGLTELKIEGIELKPQFQTDVYEYKIDIEDLEKLSIKTVSTEADADIEVLGNENLKEGENIITIHVKGKNEEDNATYQITVNKTVKVVENTENVINEVNEISGIVKEPNVKKNNSNKTTILIIAAIIILAIVAGVVIMNSNKNKSYYELDDEEDEELEMPQEMDVQETKNTNDDFFEEVKKSKGKRFK